LAGFEGPTSKERDGGMEGEECKGKRWKRRVGKGMDIPPSKFLYMPLTKNR